MQTATMQFQTVNHTNHNHTAPTVVFTPRPRLTRSIPEIWDALTPAQRAEVDAIGKCVNQMLAENPLAARPDAGAVTIWLCEKLGVIWNFTTGAWEWDTQAAE
jgi:hypothetical protein